MADHPTPTPARQPTEKQITAERQRIFKLDQRIKLALGNLRRDSWALAEGLYKFDEVGGWRYLDCETREEWLAQPEIGISRSWFFTLTKAYRDWFVVRQIEPARMAMIEPSKAAVVSAAVVSGRVTVDDALDDAEALGKRDLYEKYRVDPRGPDAPLAAEEEPVRIECPTCGQWYIPASTRADSDGGGP